MNPCLFVIIKCGQSGMQTAESKKCKITCTCTDTDKMQQLEAKHCIVFVPKQMGQNMFLKKAINYCYVYFLPYFSQRYWVV